MSEPGLGTIAVVGISGKPGKAGYYVPEYLFGAGYRVLGVSPALQTAFGQPVKQTLAALREPIDTVVLFRRSEDVPGHLDDILSLNPRPRLVWMQSGIRNQAVRERLEREGIRVVEDRCLMVEHQAGRVR